MKKQYHSLLPACLFIFCTLGLWGNETLQSPLFSVTGNLESKQSKSYSLSLQEGDFVKGVITGNPPVRLVLLDKEGKRVHILSKGERQEFMFVAGKELPYSLEVRAPQSAAYTLELKEVVPKTLQGSPEKTIQSPVLKRLKKRLAEGGSTEVFWDEIQRRKSPLLEDENVEPKLRADQVLITFLWRGAEKNVRILGAPSGNHDEMGRLGESDVWFKSYRIPKESRLTYKLAPDVPELYNSPRERRRAILATAQLDPFNPRSFPEKPLDKYDGESVVELQDAPAQLWVEKQEGVPEGSIETYRFSSEILENTRDVHLYRSVGFDSKSSNRALLVVFDAHAYLFDIPLPVILDNLVAAKKLPPVGAVLIANPTRKARSKELPPNPDFARFLAKELIPWAKEKGLDAPAEKTVIAGLSYGGLAAAYNAFIHPEIFGNAYCQSGSFWWAPDLNPHSFRDGIISTKEPEWLSKQFVDVPKKPIRFYLEAGVFERGKYMVSILESTRHFRDILKAKGYSVMHKEYSSAHDYYHWRGTFATGILSLIGL